MELQTNRKGGFDPPVRALEKLAECYVKSSGVEQVLEYLRSERRLVRFIFAGHIADALPLVSSNTPTDEPS